MSITSSLASNFYSKPGLLPILCFVLLILVIGHHIPAAAGLLFTQDGASLNDFMRLSIFATGQIHWLTAWAVSQLFVLIHQRLTEKNTSIIRVANPFDLRVLLLTLLFSGIAWFGLILGHATMFLRIEPSAFQVMSGVVSGLVGTCLMFFLARCLDHICPNYGFWILLALLSLYGNGISLISEFAWIQTGAVSPIMVVASTLLLFLAALSSAFIIFYTSKNQGSEPRHLFAILLLASVIAQFVAQFLIWGFQEAVVNGTLNISNSAFNRIFTGTFIGTQIVALFVVSTIFFGRSAHWRDVFLIVIASGTIMVAAETNRQFGGIDWSSFNPLFWAVAAWMVHLGVLTKPPVRGWLDAPWPMEPPDDNFDDEFRRGWRN